MEEIKFRGKREDNGKWVYGYPLKNKSKNIFYISYQDMSNEIFEDIEVISETVGQFTGLKDKNGKEIYEGDIIRTPDIPDIEVFWSKENSGFKGRYISKEKKENCQINDIVSLYSIVIGNIYDNPEFLKESDKR